MFDAVQPIQNPVNKPITINAKTVIEQFFSDAEIEDPVLRRKSQDNFPYRIDLVLVQKIDYEEKTTTSLVNNLCTSEISNDSRGEKLQLKTFHQKNPSVKEQALNNSSLDPSFFKNITTFN